MEFSTDIKYDLCFESIRIHVRCDHTAIFPYKETAIA